MTDGDDQHAGGDQLIAAAMLSRYRPLPNHSSNPRRHLAQLVTPSVSRSRGGVCRLLCGWPVARLDSWRRVTLHRATQVEWLPL
jgi:hypothetical protein